ncbi:MAG TPA: lipid-A-disaccharide synthase [Bacteroidota bacterium]|nr:lipid-A-disaccharide synthase [Bacteroidota bacterium]
MVQRVMMIAGEASGDLHGSGVVRELKRKQPGVEVYGVGGEKMKREGMSLVYDIRELGFMGFIEVLRHLPVIRAMEKTLEHLLRLKRPDVVVLIDYPGFNLRFAKMVKQQGIKVVYYISPQVWAWHRSRVKAMRSLVDKMLVIFPFEVDLYQKEGIDVEFVGHPLLEVLDAGLDRKNFCKRYGLDPEKQILGLLPGSRKQEIEHIFPTMLTAAKLLAAETGAEIAVGVAPTLEERYLQTLYNLGSARLVKGATYDLMMHSHFALVTSGTATLETACFGTPMFVIYRTSWITYLLGRMLVRVKNIGLVNIVAGRQIVPEFVQHRATVGKLVRTARRLLSDAPAMERMKSDLSKVRSMLGSPGASERVAERVLGMA